MNFKLIDHITHDAKQNVDLYELNFVDDMDGGLLVIHDKNKNTLTDNAYFTYVLYTHGILPDKISPHIDKLNNLIRRFKCEFIKTEDDSYELIKHLSSTYIVYKNKSKDITDSANFEFAQFVQAYLTCYTYLDILIQKEDLS